MISRVLHAVGLGRIRYVDDSGPVRRLQVDQGPVGRSKIIDNVPHVEQFGSASYPPLNSEVVMVRLGGNRGLGVAIGVNHQPSRLRNLAPGDKAIYDVRGAYVWLGATGPVINAAGFPVVIENAASITITSAGPVTVNAPQVNLGGTGGAAVARVGDNVDLGTGKIISGSSKVSAG
jgi:phage baseplate assembly protein V